MPGIELGYSGSREKDLLASIPMIGRSKDAMRIRKDRTLRDLLPGGFTSFARILHPPQDGTVKDVYEPYAKKRLEGDSRWNEVLSRLPDSLLPNEGSAPKETLRAIVDHLRPEVEEGFLYAVWEGFGFWADTRPTNDHAAQMGPYRIFHSGEISFGPWPGAGIGGSTETTNAIVPRSGDWVVVTPIDCFETFVAAAPQSIVEIITDERLVASRVTLDYPA